MSRRSQIARLTLVAALIATPSGGRQFVVGGPTSTLTSSSGSWSWHGGNKVAPFRAALENPAYFGPNGIVGDSIVTLDLATIDATTLAGVDLFVASWWADSETPPDVAAALVDYFLGGGSLLIYQDDPQHDLLGELLGTPTLAVEADGSPSNGPPPLFEGAFGLAADIVGYGNKGKLSLPHINALDGSPVALNESGEVTGALWLPGQYAAGAGTLLVVSEVDTMATTKASYSPLNANGIFTLNAVNLLLFEGSGEASIYGCGLNPPGSLTVLSGQPELGEAIEFGVDNPFGTQGAGSFSFVALSLAPQVGYPCGVAIPGLGMGFPGQSAELLIDLAPPNPVSLLDGGQWSGPGTPAVVRLSVPFNPALIQLQLYGQGILVDPMATFGIGAAMTDAVAITIGVSL